MSSRRDVDGFVADVRRVRRSRIRLVRVDLTGVDRVFPNAVVPISAAVQAMRSDGLEVGILNPPAIADRAHFDQPTDLANVKGDELSRPLGRVWQFSDATDVSKLVSATMESIVQRIECESGVVSALEWSINEVMDNVMQHAQSDRGYAMVQVHSVGHRLAICVADIGRGIYASLRASQYRPSTAQDALTLAIQPEVTRDRRIGQGNGLWGLAQIVRINNGELQLISGPAALHLDSTGEPQLSKSQFLDHKRSGTTVDFQLDTTEPVDLVHALGGHRPVNLRLDAMENDAGEHEIMVRSLLHGTGTRAAAKLLRTLVMNTLHEGSRRVSVDFSGIEMLSSSFADELVGRMLLDLGFAQFNRRIGMTGLNSDVEGIVNRVVAQRLASEP